ncbi:NBS-LRR disease-resistance protein scn3r1 [Striga asiatica]|uniref:NBS-LRR disease-resistance protein scn3r1 n=1 Tax=Striga asiatica TaxID=4170 RepID=A0A5A7R831_STRAF|nr:NBS-LRR disease-resistance protein scn3r1 [Striga asiatica]
MRSWELRQLEVFGKRDCPSYLEVFGKLIVNLCCRLPLAIVIIAGILVKRFSSSDNISVKRNAWEKVSENVHSYLTEEDGLRDPCVEEIAESYLEQLISWNLIRVEKRKPTGKVKTCLIHEFYK